nr:hypothetical protein [uncultured Draconibacterium sp.]
MRKRNKIKLLKIAFWIGAITDALAAIIMIYPKLGTYLFKHENVVITPEYRYALGMGAALMVGWTVLLIWGSFKPFERKGILVITVFPVITGIVLAQIYAVSCGYIALKNMIPIWIHLTVISSYFLSTYFKSNKLNNR